MLDIKFIRENTDLVRRDVVNKQLDASLVDKVLDLDKVRRNLILETENLKAMRNKISSEKKSSEKSRNLKEELKSKKEKTFKRISSQCPENACGKRQWT